MTQTNTETREAALPRWAQTELNRLRRDVDELSRDLADARGEIHNPQVWMGNLTEHVPVADARYRFAVLPPMVRRNNGVDLDEPFRLNHKEGWIEAYRNDGAVTLYAASRMTITLESSNVVHVGLADR